MCRQNRIPNPSCANPGCLRGFTLIELLGVIAIIGILVALLLPALQSSREAARRVQCYNNLKQIGLALHRYHEANDKLPFGSGYGSPGTKFPGVIAGTWAAVILPYIEQQNVFDTFNFSKAMCDPANTTAVTTPIAAYACPSDPQSSQPILTNRGVAAPAWQQNPARVMGLWYPGCMGPTDTNTCPRCPNPITSYPASTNYCCQGTDFGCDNGSGVGMFMRGTRSISFTQVFDGLSNTIMAGETLPAHCMWGGAYSPNFPVASTAIPLNLMDSDTYPVSIYRTSSGYKSLHVGGANFVFGDGSVQFFDSSISYLIYNNLGTRDGSETSP